MAGCRVAIGAAIGLASALGIARLPSDEDRRGRNAVVVVGHGFWKRRLGGAPDILTKTITLNDRVHTIVGVMPGEFPLPRRSGGLLPLALDEHAERTGDFWTLVHVLGRINPAREITLSGYSSGAVDAQSALGHLPS